MECSEPLVSVIVPVYNGAEHLKDAIDSLLSQTYKNIEIIAVDDCSSDTSLELLNIFDSPKIRAFPLSKRVGLVGALNYGISHANGVLLARMDQDDISHPQRIEKQVAFLVSHPGVALVGSFVRTLSENPVVWKAPISSAEIRLEMLFRNPFYHSTVMFKREVIRQLGTAYRKDFEYAEDFDLWERISCLHRTANLPECLVDYRIHPGQMSNHHPSFQRELAVGISRRVAKGLKLSNSPPAGDPAAAILWSVNSFRPLNQYAQVRKRYLLLRFLRYLKTEISALRT